MTERSAPRPSAAPRQPWPAVCLLLAACASAPDRFYALNAAADARGAAAPVLPVRLAVTVPATVDRNEMVMETGANGIAIFEHERWAAPLAGQVQRILGHDLAARRGDLIVGDRAVAGAASVALDVDLVRMTAKRGDPAAIEAQWHLRDPGGTDRFGTAVFESARPVDGFAALAAAYSDDLNLLAERLAQEIPHR